MVCEAFGCTPAEAEQQDWQLVKAILEYRAAQHGLDWEKRAAASQSDAEFLTDHPELGSGVKILHDTQREIYLKPGLARAITVLREAETERVTRGKP